MTVTVNGSIPAVTDGHVSPDVHVRVRAAENPPPAVPCGDSKPGTTGTHAISRLGWLRPLSDAHTFVSLSVTDLADSVASGWAASEQLPPLSWSWRRVCPAKGEATGRLSWLGLSAAGLVRALFHTVGFLVAVSTATRKRAGVVGCLCLVLAAVYVAGRLVG